MQHLPNILTLSRVFLIPVVLILIKMHFFISAFCLLIFSFLTDFFDGWLARRLGATSPLGALLDPVADKAVVITYSVYLGWNSLLPQGLVLLYLARNLAQLSAIPLLSWILKKEFFVKPKWQPKWATALSFIIIGVAMFHEPFALDQLSIVSPLLSAFMLVSAALEIYVLVTYLPRLIQIARGTHTTFE